MEVATQEKKYEDYQIKNAKVEELNNKAKADGVLFSDSKLEFMDNGLDNKKISEGKLEKYVETVIKHHKNRGINWENKEKDNDTGTIAVLKDKDDKVLSSIIERTNSQTNEKFYCANLQMGEKTRTLFTSNDPQNVKDGLDKIEVNRSANQVSYGIKMGIQKAKEKPREKESQSINFN